MSAAARPINYGRPVNWTSPLNRGLLGWWLSLPQLHGSRRFFDLVGKNHGTLQSTAAWYGAMSRPGSLGGTVGNGVGGTDRILVAHATTNAHPVAMTAAVWFKAFSFVEFDLVFAKTNGDSWTQGWGIYIDSSGQPTVFAGNQNSNLVAMNPSPSILNWHHLAMTWDGSTLTGYLNGISQGTDSAGTVDTTNEMSMLGENSAGIASTTVDGWADDFRLYSRCLSGGEMRRLYCASRAGYPGELNYLARKYPYHVAAAPPATFWYPRQPENPSPRPAMIPY